LNREEIDLLFTPDRSVFVCLDKDATRKGRLLHTNLTEGENVAFELKKALNRTGAVVDDEMGGEVAAEKEHTNVEHKEVE